jgi:small-conductance mechanosensitive channel
MGSDPLEQFFGLIPGTPTWTLAWVGIAVALMALGGLVYFLSGRFGAQLTPSTVDPLDRSSEEDPASEAALLPTARTFAARKAMIRVSQILFLTVFLDLGLRVLVTVHNVAWSARSLRQLEALVLSFLVLRFVHSLTGQCPAAVVYLQSLQGTRFKPWTLRNTQVLSAENVTGVAVAGVRLVRFATLVTVYYWILAFLWAIFESSGQDIRPTLLGLIFAIVLWQAFIWFDRIFPFLEEVVDGWKGGLLRSIPLRGHAFITEQDTTQVIKSLLLLLRVAISASFFASFCIYVLATLPLEQEWAGSIRSVQYALVITAAVWILLSGLSALKGVFELRLPQWKGGLVRAWNYQNTEVLSADRMVHSAGFVVRWTYLACVALVVYFYATIVFSFFEATSHWAERLVGNIKQPIVSTLMGIWNYLPHLLAIGVIYFIARSITRIIRWVFLEVERENLRFVGFYSEWALPTYQLVRLVIVVFTLIAMFPHFPGADTSHFKGISVFIGLIISLGGSGTVGHAVSGVMLTYMRPFQVGDRVQIDDTLGDVVEKTILVTRIRTAKNVDITIPNGSVLSSHIVNYSAMAQEEGVILHTSVTLGYDVAWRQVHAIMKSIAGETADVIASPEPFVLQKALGDCSVEYELNVYSRLPSATPRILSELHAGMQDAFSAAGIEILSPVYEAARDGTPSTIPKEPVPADSVPST